LTLIIAGKDNSDLEDELSTMISEISISNLLSTNESISSTSKSTPPKIKQQCARVNKIRVTAAFDSWTNIKQEHFFGIILITSQSEALVWNARNITSILPCNNEDALQELEDLFINNNNKVSLPIFNNSTIESNNLLIKQSEATKAIKTIEMTSEKIIDDSETSDNDNEENWSNIIESLG
ncbi:10584_t:CDS:2, partial [Racocetra persica]